MNKSEFQTIVKDPAARVKNYQAMVGIYFDLVTELYCKHWGESFHFAIFSGSESLKEALFATERMIANVGQFKPGMRILDVGCGIGGPALNIAEYSGAHITGVNINKQQLEIARQRANDRKLSEQVEFVQADAMQMPFADNTFDAVYIFEAGCHMPDKAAFYKECTRVLRPGGVFLGLDWFSAEGLSPEEQTKHIEPICRYHAVPNLVTLSELANHLKSVGLTVEITKDMNQDGNIIRNWELMDNKIAQNIRGLVSWLIPPVLKMLTDGGYALLDGVKANAFIIGHWYARKPNIA